MSVMLRKTAACAVTAVENHRIGEDRATRILVGDDSVAVVVGGDWVETGIVVDVGG